MTFLSLHLADWIVIIAYFVAMVWIGRTTSSSVRGQSDFFLAGRKLVMLYAVFRSAHILK